MLTKVEELKCDIVKLTAQINKERQNLKVCESNVDALRAFIDRLEVRRTNLQVQLERETAPLVKPQPTGVRAGCFDV